MSERWLPVVGYEGRYEVSDRGSVRSLLTSRLMSTRPGANGYARVNLTASDSQQKLRNVHILVLEAFRGARPFPQAHGRHLNDVRLDNRIQNLAWGTPSENNYDRVRNGGHPAANKTHCKHGHAFDLANTHISTTGQRVCRACDRRRYRLTKVAT
jgi:NUMOD4 motif/HNH endonuclease